MRKKDEIYIQVVSPEKVLWEGAAFAVSSKNSQGKFDILPHHTGFLTIVEDQPIKISNQKKKVLAEFRFPRALIYNRDNRVSVYTLGQKTEGGKQKTGGFPSRSYAILRPQTKTP